jgi:hypothetical protein
MTPVGGLTRVALSGVAEASAPTRTAGILLGVATPDSGPESPVQARVFRRGGTRILCAAGLGAAQLLAVRAAAAGVPVLVRSDQPDRWRAPQAAFAQRIFVDSRPAPELPSRQDQPVLYIDDASNGSSGADPAPATLGEARPWQCRLLIREIRSVPDLQAMASADLILLGRLPDVVAAAISSAFGLGDGAGAQLSGLRSGGIAVIRSRTLSTLSLAPTPAELQALGVQPPAPI